MRYPNTTIHATTALLLLASLASHIETRAAADSRTDQYPKGVTTTAQAHLEELRESGDLLAQRRHAWDLVVQLTEELDSRGWPLFEFWQGEDATFARIPARRFQSGIRGFSRVSPDQPKAAIDAGSVSQSVDTPVITYTLYNDAAYEHIRQHRLYLQSELLRLRQRGPMDDSVAGDRTVPPFPARAMVLKTAWWPVARAGLTALPVWDPQSNPARQGGNDYTTWRRVIAIDPHGEVRGAPPVPIDFAGKSFPAARRTDVRDFYHVKVSADLASRLSRDRSAQKLAALALGRPLAAGDFLVLVAANLATKEVRDWVWATWWWHDRAETGPFAADRPSSLVGKWRNYLLQVAFDEVAPADPDQGPHICFDPWLEGRFPDGGQGGGTASNCLACHRRASFPGAEFLPVTRGAPDLTNDAAYASGLLRTNFIWSLALHARP